MAFAYQLVCDCGYCSETVPYGMTSHSPFEFVIPVYVPKQLQLLQCVFRESDFGMRGDSLVEWIDSHGAEVVTERFGGDAIGCGVNSADMQELECPKCGNATARFKCVGF